MKPAKRGLARVLAATGYSMRGLQAACRSEAAFRQELLMLAVGALLALWLARDPLQYLLLVAPLLLVLVVELVNSAIETVVDRISDERHPLSGQAKDMGSASVMLSLILAALSWGAVIVHNHFWSGT